MTLWLFYLTHTTLCTFVSIYCDRCEASWINYSTLPSIVSCFNQACFFITTFMYFSWVNMMSADCSSNLFFCSTHFSITVFTRETKMHLPLNIFHISLKLHKIVSVLFAKCNQIKVLQLFQRKSCNLINITQDINKLNFCLDIDNIGHSMMCFCHQAILV